ncbi:MAG: tetratricopeptide repeat protein [Tenuifilaceae bacterium]|nr:tetratricopeptide repeat protein [Tenuifilaceae bacterium]
MKNAAIRILVVLSLILSAGINTMGSLQQIPEKLAKEVQGYIDQAETAKSSGDLNQAAFHLNRAANAYRVNGFPREAIQVFTQIIELNKQIGNLNAQLVIYNNIGGIYIDEEDYPNAIDSYKKALSIARQMNRKPDIASNLINIGTVQNEWSKYADAVKTLEEAHTLARELNDENMLRRCYAMLSESYEKLGNSEKSSQYFSLFTAISQKIQRDELRRRDTEARQMVEQAKSKVSEIEQIRQATEEELHQKQQALKETEENLEHVEEISREREMQINLLSKEKELQDAIIKNQRLVRNVFLFIIFVVLAFAILFLYNLNVKKKANQLLAKQNKEIAEQKDLIEMVNRDLENAFNRIDKQNRNITSSINYAQRIQEALLPKTNALKAILPDSFVYFNPRDIVSGDFFWFTGYGSTASLTQNPQSNFIKIPNLDNGQTGFLISAVDCTGHGIPGAFMSMIGFNLLETITRNGTILPNEILEKLHRAIRHQLKQETTENRDGMDMALCSIVDNGRKVLFAGAKNPLITVSKGVINYIKGDVFPVGGMQKEDHRNFTLTTIEVTEPTSFYIFSDGYTDQFGGENGKKFGTRAFKQLLLDINHLPMEEQASILKQKNIQWMGSKYRQIDDIIVIGFRVIPGKVNL